MRGMIALLWDAYDRVFPHSEQNTAFRNREAVAAYNFTAELLLLQLPYVV